MRSFRDNENRQWNVALTIGALKRVKAEIDVDLLLLDVGDPPLGARLSTDMALVCDVLFVLVKPQADALSPPVTDVQFGEGLGGRPRRLDSGALRFFPESRTPGAGQDAPGARGPGPAGDGKDHDADRRCGPGGDRRKDCQSAEAREAASLERQRTLHELAAAAGVGDIDPLTFRELAWRAEHAQRLAWNRAADLMAVIANCRPFAKGKKTYKRSDFHPLKQRGRGKKEERIVVPITALKVFVPE
jgi:hypothetical protein